MSTLMHLKNIASSKNEIKITKKLCIQISKHPRDMRARMKSYQSIIDNCKGVSVTFRKQLSLFVSKFSDGVLQIENDM